MHLAAIYAVGTLIVAILGRNRRLGFWGALFASLLITPALAFVLVMISGKTPEKGARA